MSRRTAPKGLMWVEQVCERVGLSRMTISRYRAVGKFPPPFELSANKIAWAEEDIERWLANRPARIAPRPRRLKSKKALAEKRRTEINDFLTRQEAKRLDWLT
jgi:prophage regulatory protein